jgi:hypothetical protein
MASLIPAALQRSRSSQTDGNSSTNGHAFRVPINAPLALPRIWPNTESPVRTCLWCAQALAFIPETLLRIRRV